MSTDIDDISGADIAHKADGAVIGASTSVKIASSRRRRGDRSFIGPRCHSAERLNRPIVGPQSFSEPSSEPRDHRFRAWPGGVYPVEQGVSPGQQGILLQASEAICACATPLLRLAIVASHQVSLLAPRYPAKRGSGTPRIPSPVIVKTLPRSTPSPGNLGSGGLAIEVT